MVGSVCGGRYVGMSYEEAQKVLKLDTYSKTKYLSVLKMVSHPKIIYPPHEQRDGSWSVPHILTRMIGECCGQ